MSDGVDGIVESTIVIASHPDRAVAAIITILNFATGIDPSLCAIRTPGYIPLSKGSSRPYHASYWLPGWCRRRFFGWRSGWQRRFSRRGCQGWCSCRSWCLSRCSGECFCWGGSRYWGFGWLRWEHLITTVHYQAEYEETEGKDKKPTKTLKLHRQEPIGVQDPVMFSIE